MSPFKIIASHAVTSRLLLVGLALAAPFSRALAGERVTLNFDPDWKFIKDDPAGAAAADFNDRSWVVVSAPHTYNDTDTFDDWSLPGHRGEQNQWGGRTWYRKTFTPAASWQGKKIYIEFEAVRQVSEVYLNGHLLGVCKTGFTPFGFDLTPYLKFGAPNVLAVMADNRFMKDPMERTREDEARQRSGATTKGKDGSLTAAKDNGPAPGLAQLSARVNSKIPENLDDLQADQIPWNNPHWHPAHGGIYRNVRVYVLDPLHISLPLYSFLQTAGPYVYATDISAQSAQITLEVPVQNERSADAAVELEAQVLDAAGHAVLTLTQNGQVAASGRTDLKASGALRNPQLWEPGYPYLYRVVCSLKSGGTVVDTCEIPLGIRSTRWDVDHGFFINGHHVKLHGWGQKPTDEWPGLGAAQPDWLHFYTLALMQQAGGNIVRWGHTAAGRAQIDASDRLGITVEQPGVDGESDTVGAAWKLRAMAFRDMVIYFRNNPSILIWEGGNQRVTHDHAKELRGYVDQYDPHGGRVYAHRRADAVTAEFMDIGIGTEGGREIKTLPVVEGEYDREESPRRVWDDFSPPNFGYPEGKGQTYQLNSEQYAVNEVAQYVQKLGAENHAGGANWIFSDSTSGGRVACEVARASGEVDGVRLPKEAYYVCQTMFRGVPQVHIIGHWTYPANTKKAVYVVANGDEVELFVNGKSLGHSKPTDRFLFTFHDVTWEPGEIKAVTYLDGKPIATQTKHTIGAPVALRLTPLAGPGGLRADGSDIVLFDVEAIDANGERCPTFEQRVDFTCEGPGIWRGGYNSGKINSINNTYLTLECGINRVAVRSTLTAGDITVRAKCEGLKEASVTVPSKPFPMDGGYSTVAPVVPNIRLPARRAAASAVSETAPKSTVGASIAARFIANFSYTGPTGGVRIETDAQNDKKIYLDRAYAFAGLPATLAGADWVSAADADARYSAVDLMEIAVKAGSVVSIAHDDRLARPAWLTKQFQPAGFSLTVNGQPMQVFQHTAARDESLTLGSNNEAAPTRANMYVVLVSAAK